MLHKALYSFLCVRVWFLSTGPKRAAQRQHWNLGLQGRRQYSRGFTVSFHRPSTVCHAILQYTAMICNNEYVPNFYCSVLQRVAACCSVLQCAVSQRWSSLHTTAETQCSTDTGNAAAPNGFHSGNHLLARHVKLWPIALQNVEPGSREENGLRNELQEVLESVLRENLNHPTHSCMLLWSACIQRTHAESCQVMLSHSESCYAESCQVMLSHSEPCWLKFSKWCMSCSKLLSLSQTDPDSLSCGSQGLGHTDCTLVIGRPPQTLVNNLWVSCSRPFIWVRQCNRLLGVMEHYVQISLGYQQRTAELLFPLSNRETSQSLLFSMS